MGLIDASKPRSFRSKGLLGPVIEETTTSATIDMGTDGGAQDSHPTDLPQATSLGDWGSRVMEGLSMAGMGGLISGMIGRDQDVRSAQNAVGSMNMAGGMMNPELQGRSYGQDYGGMDSPGGFGVDLDAAGSIGESPGLYAKGGKVTKGLLDMDPPGPDNVVIAAKTGERVLNEKQYGALSKEARAEVDRVLKR